VIRRVLLRLVFVAAVLVEPVCHLLGIPHPEGLAQMALPFLNEEL
jgi:hypothetical protein